MEGGDGGGVLGGHVVGRRSGGQGGRGGRGGGQLVPGRPRHRRARRVPGHVYANKAQTRTRTRTRTGLVLLAAVAAATEAAAAVLPGLVRTEGARALHGDPHLARIVTTKE